MKNYVSAKFLSAAALVGLPYLLAAATLGGTNIWTGAGNDFKWSNDANWRAVNCAGVEISPSTFRSGTTPCVFDFSALPDGAAVTNDISGANVFPMGFVFASDSPGKTWSLVANSGCAIVSRVASVNHTSTCVVPQGCTLNFGLRINNNNNSEGDFVLSGGGTLNMNSPAYNAFCKKLVVKDSILRIDATHVDINKCWVALEGDSAKLVLEKDYTILGLMSQGEGKPTVELGAHTLTQTSGKTDSKYTYNGTVTGTGDFIVKSGVLSTMSEPQTMTGLVALGNSDVTLTGDAEFPSSVQARFDYSGRLALAKSQTLKSVVGEGVTGGVEVPENATLTLTGESGATGSFNGRFTGEGSVTVDAPGYVYELDGDSHHETPLRVKAGKVALSSLPARYEPTADDSEVYLSFDNGLTTDSSINGYTFSADSGVKLTGGRAGLGADLNRGRVYGLAPNVVGNVDQTVSFWFNVPEFQSAVNMFERSPWGRQIYIQLAAADKLYVRYNYQKNGADTFGGQVEYVAATPYAGSGWHHLALTCKTHVLNANGNYYNQLRLYIDGAQIKDNLYTSGELQNAAGDYLYFGSSNARMQMDEIKFAGRAWSASDVKAEYDRGRSRSYFAGDVDAMPSPVAHYAFDDAGNPGKDSSGNGYDLSVPDKLVLYKADKSTYDSGTVTAPVVETVAGAYGKAAKFSGNFSSGRALVYGGAEFPAKIPTGNMPFSISVRFQDLSQPGPTLVGWGDVTTSKGNVRVAFGGSPSAVVCASTSDGSSHNGSESVPGKGNFYSTTQFLTGGNLGEGGNWSHVVFVWDGVSHKMRCYFDGHLYEENRYTPETDLTLTAQDLIVGCNRKATTWGGKEERFFGGYIDDIQIFDCALSAEQVERLTRDLNPDTRGIGAALTVDAGAELEVSGWTEQPLASLANSGTITVDGSARLSVSSGTIGGTVNGCGAIMAEGGTVTFAPTTGEFTGVFAAKNGSLVVSSPAADAMVILKDGGSVRGTELAADVVIPEGYTIMTDATKKNLPITATTGAVTVPTAAVWQIDATVEELRALADPVFPLASGHLTLPADFSQWTCENERIRIRYFTEAGANGTTNLYARVRVGRGLVISVR